MFKVGIAGCGFMGRMHASVYSLLDGAELSVVFDRKPERAAAFAAEFGCKAAETFEGMVQEVDIVDVCLPTVSHRHATVSALDDGKHVFCEKPMALRLEEADEMTAARDRSGNQLMIGHCIRFWPEYSRLKELIDSGEMGTLCSLNLTRYGEFPSWSSDNWLANESLSGGGVLDMHIHDTDFALYALGKPDWMRSVGTIDETGPCHVFTTMRFGSTLAQLEGGWNFPTKTPFKMAFRAVFEKGAALFDGGPLTLYRPGQEPETVTFPHMKAAGGGNISDLGGYYHELKYFIDCLTDGRKVDSATAESSRESLATALKEIEQIKAEHA